MKKHINMPTDVRTGQPRPERVSFAASGVQRPITGDDLSGDALIAQEEHFRHWLSLVDRGLIGSRPVETPEMAARREAADAIFRRRALNPQEWEARR